MPFFDADGNEIQIGADTPEVKALLESAVKEATSGLAANKAEILAEKKKLQESVDAMSEQWKGLDAEAVRGLMDRFENDEEMKLLAEGKADEVVERRTQRLRQDHEKQLAAAQTTIDDLTGKLEGTTGEVKKLKVESGLRQAAGELGLVPSAVDDAMSRALNVFKVGEDGELVAEDKTGTMFGKDGKSPLTTAEWLEGMRDKAPHWFPAPSGGGSQGGQNGGGGAFTISMSDARDSGKYQAARAAAEKAGKPLQMIEG